MKKYGIISILTVVIILCGCSDLFLGKDPANTPVNNFESFWQGFNNYYAGFVTRSINWDSMYAVYRPQVNSQMTDTELHTIFVDMLRPLNDPHIELHAKGFNTFNSFFYKNHEGNFLNLESNLPKYLTHYNGKGSVGYGFLDNNLGYIYISDFQNSSENYDRIDQIVEDFQNLKGVIIDVRNNGGGQGKEAYKIASRFADGEYLYTYERDKTGPGKASMTDFLPSYISPAGNKQFTKSLAILTNRRTGSSAEFITLMFRSYPYAIHVGDTTSGGIDGPITRELPNGWTYTPHFVVTISKSDSIAGTDTILERAMSLLK
jgi:hypothetical protein